MHPSGQTVAQDAQPVREAVFTKAGGPRGVLLMQPLADSL